MHSSTVEQQTQQKTPGWRTANLARHIIMSTVQCSATALRGVTHARTFNRSINGAPSCKHIVYNRGAVRCRHQPCFTAPGARAWTPCGRCRSRHHAAAGPRSWRCAWGRRPCAPPALLLALCRPPLPPPPPLMPALPCSCGCCRPAAGWLAASAEAGWQMPQAAHLQQQQGGAAARAIGTRQEQHKLLQPG